MAEEGGRDMVGGKNLVTFLSPSPHRAKDLSAPKLQRVCLSAAMAAPQSGSAITHGYLYGSAHNVKERALRNAAAGRCRRRRALFAKSGVWNRNSFANKVKYPDLFEAQDIK